MREWSGISGAANESVYYTRYALKCFRAYLCMMVLTIAVTAAVMLRLWNQLKAEDTQELICGYVHM